MEIRYAIDARKEGMVMGQSSHGDKYKWLDYHRGCKEHGCSIRQCARRHTKRITILLKERNTLAVKKAKFKVAFQKRGSLLPYWAPKRWTFEISTLETGFSAPRRYTHTHRKFPDLETTPDLFMENKTN